MYTPLEQSRHVSRKNDQPSLVALPAVDVKGASLLPSNCVNLEGGELSQGPPKYSDATWSTTELTLVKQQAVVKV